MKTKIFSSIEWVHRRQILTLVGRQNAKVEGGVCISWPGALTMLWESGVRSISFNVLWKTVGFSIRLVQVFNYFYICRFMKNVNLILISCRVALACKTFPGRVWTLSLQWVAEKWTSGVKLGRCVQERHFAGSEIRKPVLYTFNSLSFVKFKWLPFPWGTFGGFHVVISSEHHGHRPPAEKKKLVSFR